MSKRELIQGLLELSMTSEDANKILEEHAGLKGTAEKIAYLRGMFNIEIISRSTSEDSTKETELEDDYWAILATVVNSKWR